MCATEVNSPKFELLELLPVPVLLVDREGQILRSNPAAFEQLGILPERLSEAFRPSPVLGAMPVSLDVEAVALSRAFRLHVQPLGDLWLIAPVEDACIRSLGAFLDTVPDATMVVDASGLIRRINRQVTEMFGYDQDKLLGMEVEALMPEGLREAHRAHRRGFQAAPSTRGMGLDMDLQGRRADGSTFPVEISLSPYSAANQQFVVAAVRDISERRNLESIKVRADHLANEYEALQRSRALEARLMQSQRLESLGMLAGGVAHDFNNLLVGVLGNASLAALEVAENSSVRQYLTQIEAAAVRASELTNQMLAYAGKSPFTRKPVNLSRVVKEMFELLRSS
ncbi:MAG: PAS domain S-box protein, partial [Candidatus Eremiobacteraeota bacterium]|nr:PAS domain S-box protein [Candidatus Eremiobacteraeota bacterium]